MIPSSSALVSLKPARQAALQAIMTVEEARQRGARLPSMPHADIPAPADRAVAGLTVTLPAVFLAFTVIQKTAFPA